jgi:maltose O-acetyltransferase
MNYRLKCLGAECFDLIVNGFVARLPLRWLRVMVYRQMLGATGTDIMIGRHVRFYKPRNIYLGSRIFINRDCVLDGRGGKLVIENDVDIGMGTWIWTLEHRVASPSHAAEGRDVTIADHVWISTRSNILPGVTLGRGSVVASGAVVTRDVPERAIVGGIPARVIGQRDNALEYSIEYVTYL